MFGAEAAHERRYQIYLRVLFGLALLLRLGFVLYAHPPGQFVFSDMQSYDSIAFELLRGQHSPWHAFRPIGYSWFLALVYRLTDGSRTFVGVLQALMSAALALWSAELARAAGARRITAGVVALLVATSLPLIFYSGVLLTEIPATFCLIWGLKQASVPRRRAGRWYWLKLGLALGCAGAMRPNLLPLVPLLLLYVATAPGLLGPRDGTTGQRWRFTRAGSVAALVVALGCAAPVTLVSAYNSRVLGRPAGPSANGGMNFYLNFVDVRSVQYLGPDGGYWISPVPNGLRFTRDETTDVPLFEERHFYRAGLAYIREHPASLLRALNNFREAAGLGIQLYWPNWSGFEPLFYLYAHLFFGGALVPGLVYLVLLVVQLARRRAQPVALLLGAVCVVGTVPMYFFLGDPRVRVPFDPLWLALSGLTIQTVLAVLWGRLRSLRSPT